MKLAQTMVNGYLSKILHLSIFSKFNIPVMCSAQSLRLTSADSLIPSGDISCIVFPRWYTILVQPYKYMRISRISMKSECLSCKTNWNLSASRNQDMNIAWCTNITTFKVVKLQPGHWFQPRLFLKSYWSVSTDFVAVAMSDKWFLGFVQ